MRPTSTKPYKTSIFGFNSPNIRSPQKRISSPQHMIQLKPRNLQTRPSIPINNKPNNENTQIKYPFKVNGINDNHRLALPKQFEIKTSSNNMNVNNQIQWCKPPAQICTPFKNDIFDQPIQEEHPFPSPYIKYKIIPALDDKKCIDLTSIENPEKQLKKNYLQLWSYHGGPNQQFYINQSSNNKYYLINVANGFTVQVPEFSKQQGIHVHANPKNETENQLWELRQNGRYFQIVSFCGKVLDMENQSDSKGTRIIQWSRNKGKNQLWKIVPS